MFAMTVERIAQRTDDRPGTGYAMLCGFDAMRFRPTGETRRVYNPWPHAIEGGSIVELVPIDGDRECGDLFIGAHAAE